MNESDVDFDSLIRNKISGSSDSDFLQLLLSPIRRRTDGRLWPFANSADGLIWLTKVTSDDVEQNDFEDFVLWLHISQLRYAFAKKDIAAATEIYKICIGFELSPPDEIQDFVAGRIDKGSVIPEKSLKDRSKMRIHRAIRNEVQNLVRLFGIKVNDALDFIQMRFEEAGVQISNDTLIHYYSRHQKEAFSKSWQPDDEVYKCLTEAEIGEFRKVWLRRYPEDCHERLIKKCPDDVRKTLREYVKKVNVKKS